jgi:hypothetical protein
MVATAPNLVRRRRARIREGSRGGNHGRYLALIDSEAGTCGVTGDLPGCPSAGGRPTKHCATPSSCTTCSGGAIADGEELPGVQSTEALGTAPAVAEAIAEGTALALLDTGRPTNGHLSIDAGFLAAMDEAAAARGHDNHIVAIYGRNRSSQRTPILDPPLPNPPARGAVILGYYLTPRRNPQFVSGY